ncbi:MAG TPA: DUF1883 domain-containing protein [Baekduia sp.]|uniref:DUF1883 domain-containing protein n=1 Tax=Baekduia sp. TaxID=2600305 RepID=UPI002D791E4C|nr:DUF1883 domain-containing protein [Baekduia sp.]HET6507454.1 DUF1883 domain-containing protein [Baekduia sp.]
MATFVKHDLGRCAAGTVVEVTPEQGGNVLLIDAPNFELYRRGKRCRVVGGPVAAGATAHLQVQTDDRWMVIVDLAGGRGRIRASVRKLDPQPIDADVTATVPTRVSAQQLLSGRR